MVANILERRDNFLNKYLKFEVKDNNKGYAIKLQKSNPNSSTPLSISGEKRDCNEITMAV
jgi:hypothetical protein